MLVLYVWERSTMYDSVMYLTGILSNSVNTFSQKINSFLPKLVVDTFFGNFVVNIMYLVMLPSAQIEYT